MKIDKRNLSKINYFFFLLFISSICFIDRIMIYAFDLWVVTYFFDYFINKKWAYFQLKKTNFIYIALFMFFLVSILSLFYTENIQDGTKIIERYITILVFSIIGFLGFSKIYNIKQILIVFVYSSIFVSLLLLIIAYYQAIISREQFGNFLFRTPSFYQDVISIFKHRSYFGLIGSFAIASIYYLLTHYKNNIYEKLFYLFGVITILFLVFQSHARISSLTLFLLIIIILLLETTKKFNLPNNKLYFGFIFIGLSAAIILFNIPMITSLIHEIFGDDQRSLIWTNSIELIKQKWFLGFGIGDSQVELDKLFKQNSNFEALAHHYNSHNQFLQVWLDGGVNLFIVFISFIFSFFIFIKKTKNSLGLLLLISLVISMLVEVLLNRILGITLVCLAPILYTLSQNSESVDIYNNEINIIKTFVHKLFAIIYILAVMFIISILLLFKPKFDSTNPKTYASQPFTIVPYSSISKESSEIPELTDGFKISRTFLNEHNNGNESSYMILSEKKLNDGDSLHASIYYKVSKDFRNSKVGFSIGGPNLGYSTKYINPNENDKWLKVEVGKKFNMGTAKIIISYSSTNSLHPEGDITFAFPEIKAIKKD